MTRLFVTLSVSCTIEWRSFSSKSKGLQKNFIFRPDILWQNQTHPLGGFFQDVTQFRGVIEFWSLWHGICCLPKYLILGGVTLKVLMRSKGFSLIEVLIALVILSVSLLGMAGLMVTTTKNNSWGGHMTEAATFAQDKLEQLRATPFGMIAVNTTTTDNPVGSTGITYTRSWVAVPNILPPNNTLDVITITVSWTDTTPPLN